MRQRRRIDLEIGRRIFEDFSFALSTSDYGSRTGRMVARHYGRVDELAWRELSDLHHKTLDRADEIIKAGQQRLADTDEPVEFFATLLPPELPRPVTAVASEGRKASD